jgi:hypothetical protein
MNKSIEIELSDNGNNLCIFFGGIAAGIEMPSFEFYNASKIIIEHKMFIRVFSQCWYQEGLPEISEDIFFTTQHIKKKKRYINPGRVYFVGTLTGGYATIAFSELKKGDEMRIVSHTGQCRLCIRKKKMITAFAMENRR